MAGTGEQEVTAEIGHFSLILALMVAIVQSTIPMVGAHKRDESWMAIADSAALCQGLLIALSFMSLIWCYITSDFSVLNVAENSHTDKPLLYKITGVWGNHEGSMMLWVFILGFYGAALSSIGKNLPIILRSRVLAIHGIIGTSFLLFIILTSNPFLRLDPAPTNGHGLNPILQDPGLAFHPPLLYLGYVGFSMAFSFAIAALIEGQVNAAWARWVRPWTLVAWCSLTAGIATGSWWAYYTLGWGGWWYWDPVENASFMPWLAGTALLHTAIVVEKRDALKAWTVLLAILTFSLSLLGTFLVRSGILTSVHSFTSDPGRGIFVLAILAFLTGGSFLLFAFRAGKLIDTGLFAPISREGGLLINNMLLISGIGTVLLGTLYPMIADALGLGKISVGPPFFNIVFLPLMIPLILLMGIGPHLSWKRSDILGILLRLRIIFLICLGTAIAGWLITGNKAIFILTAGGYFLAIWLFLTNFLEFIGHRKILRRSFLGMIVAHLGLAIVIAGITGSSAGRIEMIQIMQPGQSITISGIDVTFDSVDKNIAGPNYVAMRGNFTARDHGRVIASMKPEHRQFINPPRPTTNAAIHTNLLSDIYVVLGEPDKSGGYVTRIYKNLMVPWIFLGAIIMTIGGILSLSDTRLRRQNHA